MPEPVRILLRMLASLVTSLQDLTPLIIALLVTALLMLFRPQIVQLVGRVTTLHAHVGRVQLEAGLIEPSDQQDAEVSEDAPDTLADKPSDAGPPEALVDNHQVADAETESEPTPEDTLTSDDVNEVRRAMVLAMIAKDEERGQALLARLRVVETSGTERKLDQARYLSLRQRVFKDDDAGAALKQLADDDSIRPQVLNMIGLTMTQAGEPSVAATLFAEAAAATQDADDRVQYLINQAGSLVSAGDLDAAVELLENELATQPSKNAASLWRSLAEAYEAKSEPEPRALALQQALRERPNDTQLRFNVAYVVSNADDDSLSPFVVHHYTHVVSQAPDYQWALNNLGVQYRRLEMPLLAVEQYEAAREQKNTLAMANLASHYMQAGFGPQAESILKEALSEERPHANVGAGLAELARLQDRESERRDALLQTGQQQAEFLTRYGRARVRANTKAFAGDWVGESGARLVVQISEGQLIATWLLNQKKFRVLGPVHGEAAGLEYQEMEYLKIGDKQTEYGYKKQAEDRWLLTEDHATIEIMRVRAAETGILRLERAMP
jgi:tetratricopeptide (TPR) repeat protein